jgi:hypothetical protein
MNNNKDTYKQPLIYNSQIDTTQIKSVILIDSTVNEAELFYNSVNQSTFSIIYSYNSDREELLNLLTTKFTEIIRLGLVMHNSSFPYKKFINDEYFFNESDIETESRSKNLTFIIDIIKKFNIKNFDNLACASLLNGKWKQYYDFLHSTTGVIIGASDDNTGNIKYSGDWILESSGENIQNIYWNNNILNYSSKLAATQLSQSGGNIYLRQTTVTSNVDYSTDNINWTSIGTNWPLEITNSSPSANNILTVNFTTNITLNNTTVGNLANFYIRILSEYITIDGQSYILTITEPPTLNTDIYYTNFIGLIKNGGTAEGFANFKIQNIGVVVDSSISSTTTLPGGAGWICQSNFAIRNTTVSIELANCEVRSCYSTGRIGGNGGGIIGLLSTGSAYNCYSTGYLMDSAGGIFGNSSFNTARASNCYSTGNSGTKDGGCGGIFGSSCQGVAEYCYSTGIIGATCGGIFGSSSGNGFYSYRGAAIALNCYSLGTIAPRSGGIFGTWSSGYAINCYSRGTISDVVSSSWGGSGGIFGKWCSGTAINCYSIGDIKSGGGGIFGSGPGTIKIKNCYSSGKLLYNVTNDGKFKGGLIGDDPNSDIFYTNTYIQGVTVENSYAENLTLYDLNAITSTNNNSWNDLRASTYLVGAVGSLWTPTQTTDMPPIKYFSFNIPTTTRTLNGLAITSPRSYSATPFTPTLPTSSTTSGTITYFSFNTLVTSVNSTTGEVTMLIGGDTAIIAILSGDSTYQAHAVFVQLTISRATRTLTGYSLSNQLLTVGGTITPTAPSFSTGTGTLTYSSNNQSVATINSTTGVITMVSSGSVTMTAFSPQTSQYNATSISVAFLISLNARLYLGTSPVTVPGYYFISSSNNSAVNGKTIKVDSSGFVTILTNPNFYDTNSKNIYSNNIKTELGEGGSLILTKPGGIKYSFDGITWN